jgi:hypothetical protein
MGHVTKVPFGILRTQEQRKGLFVLANSASVSLGIRETSARYVDRVPEILRGGGQSRERRTHRAALSPWVTRWIGYWRRYDGRG